MAQQPPSATAMKVSELSQTAKNSFEIRPDAKGAESIAQELDLSTVRKLRFEGEITAVGAADWMLSGRLGATVVQPCVVTLEPVTTRIDTDVLRQYLHDFETPDEPEAEMPEDETTERLGAFIDPGAVMIEALALAVPDYPRKDGAAVGELIYTEPGQAPMTDEDARPFASLADFKAKLEKGDG